MRFKLKMINAHSITDPSSDFGHWKIEIDPVNHDLFSFKSYIFILNFSKSIWGHLMVMQTNLSKGKVFWFIPRIPKMVFFFCYNHFLTFWLKHRELNPKKLSCPKIHQILCFWCLKSSTHSKESNGTIVSPIHAF